MNYFLVRRQTLLKDLKKDNVDTYLVTNPVNVRYLTGFTGDSSYLVANAKQVILISDDRYAEQIQEECPGIEVHIRPHSKTTPEAAAEVLNKTAAKAVAVEADHITVSLFEYLKEAAAKTAFLQLRGKVESMRAVKDPMEIEHIRDAVRTAERAFIMFKAMLRESDTEKDLSDNMETYLRRAGADRSSFPTIVAVGDRGALPHAVPTDKQLAEGSKLLVDWGAEKHGYKSDMTRTFRSPFQVAPNRRNKQERVGFHLEEIYDVVLKAQEAAIASIRHGVPCKEVDAAARQVFQNAKLRDVKDANLNDYFTHGLGHGLGLETHESPRLRQNSTDVLEAGMIVTVEPAVYIPGWGGVRIEDDVLVTKEGATLLTTLPRDLGGLMTAVDR
jgi:Xaa-Pro aminopeptidase